MKNLARIKDFYEKKNIIDTPNIINGESIPSLKDLLSKVNFDELILDTPTNFHGILF